MSTVMLYRPQSPDAWYKGQEVIKLESLGIALDAIILPADGGKSVQGWFKNPKDLLPIKKLKNDDSGKNSK